MGIEGHTEKTPHCVVLRRQRERRLRAHGFTVSPGPLGGKDMGSGEPRNKSCLCVRPYLLMQ